MKKSVRALVGMVVLDLAMLACTAWMILQVRTGAWHAPDEARAISTITTTMGSAIGVVTAILLVAFFVHHSKGN